MKLNLTVKTIVFVTLISVIKPLNLCAQISQTAKVALDCSASGQLGPTRPLILGMNTIFSQEPVWGNVCDIATGAIYPQFVEAFEDSHPTIARYPGGLLANEFHWYQTIGPISGRRPQIYPDSSTSNFPYFGIDEFLQLVSQVKGCQALMTVNVSNPYTYPASGPSSVTYQGGSAQEAAAWVAYCNFPSVAGTPDIQIGGDDYNKNLSWQTAGYWAALRKKNGHPDPYNVTYWELGNEVNQGAMDSHGNALTSPPYDYFLLSAGDYATKVAKVIPLMKSIDSTIKIGLVGYSAPCLTTVTTTLSGQSIVDVVSPKDIATSIPWMKSVFRKLVTSNVAFDFLVVHIYNAFTMEALQNPPSQSQITYDNLRDDFSIAAQSWTYTQLNQYQSDIAKMQAWLNEYNQATPKGTPKAQMWMTECGRFPSVSQTQMGEGRNLLIALCDADFLMQNLMTVNLQSSCHYGFNAGGFGTIFCGNNQVYFSTPPATSKGVVTLFPMHTVFSMFGASVLSQNSGTIFTPVTTCNKFNLTYAGKFYTPDTVRAVAAINQAGTKLDIFVINKNISAPVNLTISAANLPKKIVSVTATELNSWKSPSDLSYPVDASTQTDDNTYPLFADNWTNYQDVYEKTKQLITGDILSNTVSTGGSISATIQDVNVSPHSLTWYSCSLQ